MHRFTPMRRSGRVGLAAMLVFGAWGTAAAEDGWKTVLTGPLSVKTREVKGTDVYEYLVEGAFEAEVVDVQAALTEPERFPKFMPHVTETRVLEEAGRSSRVYTRIEPPVGGSRDYVTEVKLLESAQADGSGTFRQEWRAVPDSIPERSGVTRIRINEGSWEISRREGGGSRFTYRFRVDPGTWVPGFVQEMANKKAIPQSIRAIEGEARRRAQLRGSGLSGAQP